MRRPTKKRREGEAMKTSNKAIVAFFVAGLVVGALVPALNLNHLKKPIWGGLLVLGAVTVGYLAIREQRAEAKNKSANRN